MVTTPGLWPLPHLHLSHPLVSGLPRSPHGSAPLLLVFSNAAAAPTVHSHSSSSRRPLPRNLGPAARWLPPFPVCVPRHPSMLQELTAVPRAARGAEGSTAGLLPRAAHTGPQTSPPDGPSSLEGAVGPAVGRSVRCQDRSVQGPAGTRPSSPWVC